MKDKSLIKQAIVNDGLDKKINRASWLSFCGDDQLKNALIEAFGFEVWKVGRSINQSGYKRRLRVKNRIGKELLLGSVQFLTLTFSDATLSKTSEATRRKYVSRFLKRNCSCYVANIDYGGKKGREHYHALVVSEFVEFKEWHRLGAIKTEKVKASDDDLEKVARYTAKLSNHALKVNDGKAPRLIYSRRKNLV